MRILLLLCYCLVASSWAFRPQSRLPASSSRLFASTSDAGANTSTKKMATIVGAGPVGLATALTLANAPHYYDVTVLEKSKRDYDPTKAYLLLVNQRGQEWTQKFPRVHELLLERGCIQSMSNVVVVPADPKAPLPDPKPFGAGQPSNVFMQRQMVADIIEEVIEEEQKKPTDSRMGKIKILTSKQCKSIQSLDEGRVQVMVQDTKDASRSYEEAYVSDLLIGADGMNSAVRNCLADGSHSKTTWLNEHHRQFRPKAWTSPATGLRIKVLQFPPRFEIPKGDGTVLKTNSDEIYAIRSAYKGRFNYLSFGILPLKDPDAPRLTNAITRPNHDLWKLKTTAEVKEWFLKAFPRLKLNEMISDEEWERFTKSKGATFPKCQYTPKLQVSHPSGESGVVLVGDALHAFPPDIAQGINAGFGDVIALDRALQGKNVMTGEDKEIETTPSIGEALQEYERVRLPEIRALVRMSRFGSPYQYKQPLRKDRIGRYLWTSNVVLRALLNKISFGIVPQCAILLAFERSDLSFRQVVRRADLTTVGLTTVLTGILWKTLISRLVV